LNRAITTCSDLQAIAKNNNTGSMILILGPSKSDHECAISDYLHLSGKMGQNRAFRNDFLRSYNKCIA